MRELGYRSKIVVPVVNRENVFGALTLVRLGAEATPFDAVDLLIAEDLGRRAGVAYENARSYARQLRVATLLQEAALPRALPTIPNARFDAVYRPGSSDVLVGGDWYDAFAIEGSQVGISVGDVLGSGIGAAVTMGRLRQAMESAAYVLADPSAMLYAADRVLTLNDPDVYATALAAIYDGARRELRLASGGHPGPLERRPDGTVIDRSMHGFMLGLEPRFRSDEERIAVPPGTSIVFFTDGLVEQTRDLDEGYRRLRAAVAALDPRSPHPARDVVSAVVEGALHDDVAVLILIGS
jgi:serine phosphatase RsbU (regulator of sigma subunit)